MIKLKRLQILTKEATINEKRDIQFITTEIYVKKDQILGISMHIHEKTIKDSWADIATLNHLEKENINLCTVICKNITNIGNTIIDEQIKKLIDESE